MRKVFAPSPFLRDLFVTAGTSLVTAGSLILVTRALAQGLGPDGFGLYALSRRMLAVITPCLSLGMGAAVARYIATERGENKQLQILTSGVMLVVLTSITLLSGGLVVFRVVPLSSFVQTDVQSILPVTVFMAIGYAFYLLLYGFYRGVGRMYTANLWQLAIVAFGPVVIVQLFAGVASISQILALMGGLYLLALIPLGSLLWHGQHLSLRPQSALASMKTLLRYGVPRVPGTSALAAIFASGPFLAPYVLSLKAVGELSIGQLFLTMTEACLAALGVVLLPKAAQLFADHKTAFLRQRIGDLLVFVLHTGTFVSLQLMLWADTLIHIWLGADYYDAILLSRIMFLGFVPYFLYVTFRSIIDAIEERAINTCNIYVALAVTIVTSLTGVIVGFGSVGLALGLTLGMSSLGITTIGYLYKAGWVHVSRYHFFEFCTLNFGAVGVGWSIRKFYGMDMVPIVMLGCIGMLETLLFAAYFMVLRWLNVAWTIEVENRILKRQAQ
ncbi:MAG: oligosaccharide flippase family protein [Candidatus Binatia bacterium]